MTGREELREQVAAIKPGDTVTARFKDDGPAGEFTITGLVHQTSFGIDGGDLLNVAFWPLKDAVAIESHEPAKPPEPPEPDAWGSVIVATTTDGARRWLVRLGRNWLVSEGALHAYGDLTDVEVLRYGITTRAFWRSG